ncbi:uncharacterized protein [Miscanthus floridulus]|uniref:uncharacterized protein isoform X1 n=1 Tax=Miscanthus floridulus TaxID=154761 RepID=UPI00345AA6E2
MIDHRCDTVQAVPDIGPTVKSAATAQMDAAVIALSRELSKLRTGRATPGMLDHIMVENAGVKVALNRIAVVSILDAHTLSVMPYDPTSMKSIEHAIVSSPLGINPTPDGNRIIAAIPPLTKENIQCYCSSWKILFMLEFGERKTLLRLEKRPANQRKLTSRTRCKSAEDFKQST